MTKGSNGKALIAYFSKTGTTQRAAEEIQKLTGADMFRIEPVQAYPEEYQRTTEIARDELNQNARTQVKGKVDDMAQYDTIFVATRSGGWNRRCPCSRSWNPMTSTARR